MPGAYAWYFRDIPPRVPTADCHRCEDLALLYIGIAPKAPPKNGARPSSQRLVDRVRYHYRGNAEGSTLRLTLGCLLSETLGIELRRVGSGKRMTFADGEGALSGWMAENAFMTWVVDAAPWVLEEELISGLSLSLNLDMNRGHAFGANLKGARNQKKGRTIATYYLKRQYDMSLVERAQEMVMTRLTLRSGIVSNRGNSSETDDSVRKNQRSCKAFEGFRYVRP